MSPHVRVQNLDKAFGGKPAIKDVGFDVGRGEIFGLLGHNGAGKSTTFGILLGLVKPDRGEAEISGRSVLRDREGALARTGAIFESPAFYDYLSGWSNLRFFVSLSGRLPPRERLEEIVGLVGLADRIGDPVRTYSHGMRQRLGLAQALLPNPEFLLLDEPTNGLDPGGIREMREMILRLRDELGLSVLLSSHLLSEVQVLCDRIAILHHGRLVFSGEWTRRPTRWRFLGEGPVGATLRGLGLVESGGVWSLPEGFDPADAVAALVRAGCRVKEATAVTQTLEDFYLETIGPPAGPPEGTR